MNEQGHVWLDGRNNSIPLTQNLTKGINSIPPQALCSGRQTHKVWCPFKKTTPPHKGGPHNSTDNTQAPPFLGTPTSSIPTDQTKTMTGFIETTYYIKEKKRKKGNIYKTKKGKMYKTEKISKDTLRLFQYLKLKNKNKQKMNSLLFCTLVGSFNPDMPEDILNNIRAFVRNQSASSLMQMMQRNNAIDIALQEAEPILNIINMNNSTIHHNQDSNQTVSNTTHPSDQNTMQNQTVSHTTDELQNTLTWQD